MRLSAIYHEDAAREPLEGDHESVAARTLFVGEDNPLSTDPAHALINYPSNCSGHRLQSAILRVDEDDYLATWRTNLCEGGWDLDVARKRARVLCCGDRPWSVWGDDLDPDAANGDDVPARALHGAIVLLGRRVALAFADLLGEIMDPFEDRLFDGGLRVVALPHPSGMNRVWNINGNILRARNVMRAFGYPAHPSTLGPPITTVSP